MESDLQDEDDHPSREDVLNNPDISGTHSDINGQSGEDGLGHQRPLTELYDQLRSLLNHTKTERILENRWNRVKKYYVDDYRAFFQQDMMTAELSHLPRRASQNGALEPQRHRSTQVGVVLWRWAERDRLFDALSKGGRHDLPALAEAIGSKSILEVVDFLEVMQNQLYEDHMFANILQQSGSVRAGTLAATEVPTKCRNALTKAADALLVLQAKHDHLVAQPNKARPWSQFRVDEEAAKAFDEIALRLEEENEAFPADLVEMLDSTELFHVNGFISLSINVFMNSGDDQMYNNWNVLAVDDEEEPAILLETLSEFHDLVINLTRKLVQATIFIAQSRKRCTSKKNQYNSHNTVRPQDVVDALDVLGLPRFDSWNYWRAVPRRYGLAVLPLGPEVYWIEDETEGVTEFPHDVLEECLAAKSRKEYARLWRAWYENGNQPREDVNGEVEETENEEDGIETGSEVGSQSVQEAIVPQDSTHVDHPVLTSDVNTSHTAQASTTVEHEVPHDQSLFVSSPIVQPQSDSGSDDPLYIPSKSPSQAPTHSSARHTASRSPSSSPSASPTASRPASPKPPSPTFPDFIPLTSADNELLWRDNHDAIEEAHLESIDHAADLADTARLWETIATNPAYFNRGMVPDLPNPDADAATNAAKFAKSNREAKRLTENELLEWKWEDKLEWKAEWENREQLKLREWDMTKRVRPGDEEVEDGRGGNGEGQEAVGQASRRKRRRIVPNMAEDDGHDGEGEETTSGRSTRSASEMLDEAHDDEEGNDYNGDDDDDDDDNEDERAHHANGQMD